ncbi:hypothetical protein PPNK14_23390 [Pectobacterium parmentieri]
MPENTSGGGHWQAFDGSHIRILLYVCSKADEYITCENNNRDSEEVEK